MRLHYTKHSFGDAEAEAAAEVVRNGWVSQGPTLRAFEERFAAFCTAPHCVAVNNGTTALHVAYRALGVGAGDEVLVPSHTFLATGNAAYLCGADVTLMDCGADMNVTFAAVEKGLTERTKVVTVVPYGGLPVSDLPEIYELCRSRGIYVVEDAAHALGASQRGPDGADAACGSCTYSDLATFSFHPAKAICTGEGGAITVRDDALAARVLLTRNHGMHRGASEGNTGGGDGPWFITMETLGPNARLSDILAAIGLAQMDRLDGFLARRRELATRYMEAFAGLPGLNVPHEPEGLRSAWNLFALRVDAGAEARRSLYDALAAADVFCQVLWTPLHMQPYYIDRGGIDAADFAETARVYASSLCLPLFPDLTNDDQDRVIDAVRSWNQKRDA